MPRIKQENKLFHLCFREGNVSLKPQWSQTLSWDIICCHRSVYVYNRHYHAGLSQILSCDNICCHLSVYIYNRHAGLSDIVLCVLLLYISVPMLSSLQTTVGLCRSYQTWSYCILHCLVSVFMYPPQEHSVIMGCRPD